MLIGAQERKNNELTKRSLLFDLLFRLIWRAHLFEESKELSWLEIYWQIPKRIFDNKSRNSFLLIWIWIKMNAVDCYCYGYCLLEINSFMHGEIKKMIRAYVNTPATAKLDMSEYQKCDHSFRFSKGSQKTLKFIFIR